MPDVIFPGRRLVVALLGLVAVVAHGAEGGAQLTEDEFLGEIPMVYAASRLPQRTQDAAGAITVIDREQIRASGARDITDLFRTVPGFQVGVSTGGKPVVTYHGLSGATSQRLQVYVDGRSVYAPYLFGGVDWGTVNVPIDEIERIEIQRGASSVSYGANAFLGVIHIVTRHAGQAVGVAAELNQGNRGIADRSVRLGMASDGVQWRVAAGTRSDGGLVGRFDPYQVDYVDVRADYQLARNQELTLFGGATRNRYWAGFDGRLVDPLRPERSETSFLQARYRYVVGPNEEWRLAYSHTLDTGGGSFTVPLLDTSLLEIDSSRRATRDVFEYQHFAKLTPRVRASWGAEYRHDRLQSRQLFNTFEPLSTNSFRVYLNSEIKPSDGLTLNVGGLWERETLSESQFAPRISLNWFPSPGQTFKLGYSSAFRTPSLFEQRSDWRITRGDDTLDIRYLSRGGLVPERVRTWDLVYQGQMPRAKLSLDARVFHEKFSNLITGELYLLPPNEAHIPNAVAYDLRNNASAASTGIEYQLTWRPLPKSSLSFTQYLANPRASSSRVLDSIPQRGASLVASHAWGEGWSGHLSYSYQAPMKWLDEATPADVQRLAVVRVARAFRVGGVAARVAASWRGPVGTLNEFRELQSIPKQFWITLSAEY